MPLCNNEPWPSKPLLSVCGLSPFELLSECTLHFWLGSPHKPWYFRNTLIQSSGYYHLAFLKVAQVFTPAHFSCIQHANYCLLTIYLIHVQLLWWCTLHLWAVIMYLFISVHLSVLGTCTKSRDLVTLHIRHHSGEKCNLSEFVTTVNFEAVPKVEKPW